MPTLITFRKLRSRRVVTEPVTIDPPTGLVASAYARRALVGARFGWLRPVLLVPDGDINTPGDRMVLARRGFGREA